MATPRPTAPPARRAACALLLVATLLALLPGGAARAAPLPGPGRWLPAAAPALYHLADPAVALADGSVLLAGERYLPATDTWVPTGAPARVGPRHAAARLADGRVLAAGGEGGTAIATAGADLYDPATGAWSPVADMRSPRLGHALVALPDGTALAVGGFSGYEVAASAERYHPATNTWTPTGPVATARAYQSATLLPDGRVLLVGGADRATFRHATAELYTPATDTWAPAAALPERRTSHSATPLGDGTVLVAGGRDSGPPSATAARYDPAADAWRPTFGLRHKVVAHPAASLPGGGALVVGAGWAERFDPAAPAPAFADVPPGAAGLEAVTNLAARGIIRGYGDGRFGAGDPLLRAQVAAVVVRGLAWDRERHDPPFPDRGPVDDELWAAVGILAWHKVALGYPDGTYDPTGPVLKIQVVSLVARAQRMAGYWDDRPDGNTYYPNVPASSGARADLTQYVAHAGALPDAPDPARPWADWDAPATREWTARAIWQAFNSPGGASR